MSNELPQIGLYVQWMVDGRLSEQTFLPASERSPIEIVEALAALVPDGAVPAVVGFRLGNTSTTWFTSDGNLNAIQQFRQQAASMTRSPPPPNRF